MNITSSEVLEVLYAARQRLKGDEPFAFMDYCSCTCGHIYSSAAGAATEDPFDVMMPAISSRWEAVIERTASALGWTGGRSGDAVRHVSALTMEAAGTKTIHREHAIEVVERAIAAIEMEHVEDLLAVQQHTPSAAAPVAA